MQKEPLTDKLIRGFFWVAYAVFLLASTPHIAAYFHHFSRTTNPIADIWEWCISYLIALMIDAGEIIVSIVIVRAKAGGANWFQLTRYWLVAFFILSLSWFFNWQYNMVFKDDTFLIADNTSINLDLMFTSLKFTVGQLNPVVGGAYLVLLLMFNDVAHWFRSMTKVETAEQIEKQNEELESKKAALIKRRELEIAINGGSTLEKKDAVDSAFDLAEKAKNRFAKLRKTNDLQKPDIAKNVTETTAPKDANVAQNLTTQEVEISQETTSSSQRDLGLNGNIHHEVNYPQTNPVTPEPGSLDFTQNANPFYGYEVENHAPDLAEMEPETQAYKDVVFEDLYAETEIAEEPEEEPATEPLERAETSEEQAQTKRRDTGSYKKLSTSAQKAVSSGKKYTSAEEIAELPEVSKALNFTGRGAPLRRLQAVNDAIQRKEIRWYGGGYSHSAVIKWLEGQKESA